MNIYINGEQHPLKASIVTLAGLLEQQGYDLNGCDLKSGDLKGSARSRMVAALNGVVIPADAYGSTTIASGDRVDVLGVITGG